MAEFPALPLWTDAYLGDTMHLDAVEHGAYLLLLISAWRTEGTTLPNDDRLLARYARCTPKTWARIRPVIAEFFSINDSSWTQLRLSEEKFIVTQKRDAAAANGRLSALKRKKRHSTKRPTERERSDQLNGNEATNGLSTPTPIPTPTPNSSKNVDDGAEAENLEVWDAVRLSNELTRVAGIRNLDPGPISDNVKSVREWLEAGADPPLIIPVIQTMRDKTQNGISRLSYFDRAIRAAIAKRDHPNGNPSADDFSTIRDPLLRRYLERGGSLGV